MDKFRQKKIGKQHVSVNEWNGLWEYWNDTNFLHWPLYTREEAGGMYSAIGQRLISESGKKMFDIQSG